MAFPEFAYRWRLYAFSGSLLLAEEPGMIFRKSGLRTGIEQATMVSPSSAAAHQSKGGRAQV